MGLVRRRHFATRGRQLLGIEDELFGESAGLLGGELTVVDDGREIRGPAARSSPPSRRPAPAASPTSSPPSRASRTRSSAPSCPGVLVVQGGPGTGKTVVALHRAAYLLYTHRFPLEGQGVLVVGPNRLFLGYIEQVLPSLGEAGVELAVLADLVARAVRGPGRRPRRSPPGSRATCAWPRCWPRRCATASARCGATCGSATACRRSRSRRDQSQASSPTPGAASARTTPAAGSSRRACSPRWPPARRDDRSRPHEVRDRLRHAPEVREALERMWPVLTPAELLHDLFGSRGAAATSPPAARSPSAERAGRCSRAARPTTSTTSRGPTTTCRCSTRPARCSAPSPAGGVRGAADDDEVRTYGHIVVDEAQDLSPMQLRMLTRRSLNGSMTVVGDIAQSTGRVGPRRLGRDPRPPARPPAAAPRRAHHRLPAPRPEHGAGHQGAAPRRPRPHAAPLGPPGRRASRASSRRRRRRAAAAAVEQAAASSELDAVGPGNVAVIVPDSLVDARRRRARRAPASSSAGPPRNGLDSQITVVPVSLVKGLELDASVVVEPAAIVDEEAQGARSLYVALTRATKRLAIVHAGDLPDVLALSDAAAPIARDVAGRRAIRGGQVVTRMRWLAKAPMPTWRPSTSTVVVPSGDAAVIVPDLPGHARRRPRGTRAGRG